MKHFITLTAIIIATLSIPVAAISQNGPKHPKEKLDVLLIGQFDLAKKGAGFSKNTLLLGEQAFLKKFGKPLKATLEHSEEEEADMKHYSYRGANIWYLKNNLEAINITSADYCFQMSNGSVISVGDPISLVAHLFPSSWANKAFPEQVFVSLRNQVGPVDAHLIFEYDSNTNLIKGISVQ
ncbi:MAG: hypothetical protein PHD73_11665 [Sediminibacterium sp.]|nr:hypothetical protein [Sediminibacterium sp.]